MSGSVLYLSIVAKVKFKLQMKWLQPTLVENVQAKWDYADVASHSSIIDGTSTHFFPDTLLWLWKNTNRLKIYRRDTNATYIFENTQHIIWILNVTTSADFCPLWAGHMFVDNKTVEGWLIEVLKTFQWRVWLLNIFGNTAVRRKLANNKLGKISVGSK